MDDTFSRASMYACQFFPGECLPAYDPYSPNVLALIVVVLGLGLAVLGAQELVRN